MSYQARDRDIDLIKARGNNKCYGMGLGIMLLDDVYPGFPGDLRNASGFEFPVQYEVVHGVNNLNLMHSDDRQALLVPIIDTAKKLEDMGCRAIAAECGYFARFQKEVSEAVSVPVYMSSLLQLPFIQHVIGKNKSVCILCAEKNALTDEHLTSVGIDLASNFFICGTQDDYVIEDFANLWDERIRPSIPYASYRHIEEKIVEISLDISRKNPNLGAILMECTGMQPFARSIQRRLDIPIFSWGTMLDLAYKSVVHNDYYGYV